jgi:hypothetical protein
LIFFTLKDSDTVVSTVNDTEDYDKESEDEETVEDNSDDPVENEEARRAALNKLSQVKKCEILLLALQDLDVVGREMFGDDLKEKRELQREERKKPIAQIHEAVDYFQQQANGCRANLLAATINQVDATRVNECLWELEYQDILNKY